MNGAVAQAFLHENVPHVFPIYDFPEIKTFTESWEEIRLFIQDIEQKHPMVTKAKRVHWDGSKEDIADDDYITISRDDVIPRLDLSN
jgi:hypothetical protein